MAAAASDFTISVGGCGKEQGGRGRDGNNGACRRKAQDRIELARSRVQSTSKRVSLSVDVMALNIFGSVSGGGELLHM